MTEHSILDVSFYKGKKVLVTGHTGFKGSWMCKALSMMGAEVTGYSLEPPTDPSLFELCKIGNDIHSIIGDVRDLDHLMQVFEEKKPEIVFHMAAQPIVRESYKHPVYTYDVNVMGTVNVMECVRQTRSVRSVINVTTDKVYLNRDRRERFKETDELNGFDPYSNSKSCSELVTNCYVNSYFQDMNVAVSTVRAGNVIGGGDFAVDRIIPDCFRAASEQKTIILRNPDAVRPFEHVLESVSVYLMIAEKQYEDQKFSGSYNVGPEDYDCHSVEELVRIFCDKWEVYTGKRPLWMSQKEGGPKEAGFLRLDCGKLKETFGWKPVWNLKDSVDQTAKWYCAYLKGGDVVECMEKQIGEFYEVKSEISKVDR